MERRSDGLFDSSASFIAKSPKRHAVVTRATRARFAIPLLFGSTLAGALPAFADSSGYYAPENWTLTNIDADGSLNASGAPTSIQLIGGNNVTSVSGSTTLLITAPASGTVSFDWSTESSDDTYYDDFLFVLIGGTTI